MVARGRGFFPGSACATLIAMTTTPTAPDPNKIGISYSGGGPLLIVELGIARAFVQSGIKPAVISGASAGSIAGAAHALDVDTGKGIELTVAEVGHMSNSTLRLDAGDFALRLVHEGAHLKAIGDNAPAAGLISGVLQQLLGVTDLTLGAFGQPLSNGQATPDLEVVATDLFAQTGFWFPAAANLSTAIITSSAVPGIFPWVSYPDPAGVKYLVDGGVVENQPLERLADLGCGKIYACAVGAGPRSTEPTNLIDNVLRSINISIHACSKTEENLLRSQLPAGCRVIHIHPEITTEIVDFNFTPAFVNQVVDEACQLTLDWLKTDPQT
jgi:predicted acylesterase/phospholipase RssA